MLANRTILVTGGARGLGREICLGIAKAGGSVVVADIDQAGAEHTVELLREQKATARFQFLDLEDPDAIRLATDEIGKNEQVLHGLVNNGAIATGIGGKAYDEIDIEIWDKVMRVNVRGQWLMIRQATPLLELADQPRIVNIASDTALWGAPKLLSYVASKGAVISMTRSLARELGEKNIGITAVAPGILTTESTEYVPPERHRHYETNRAVQGPQPPEDVTGTINFLLSSEAMALTGQCLPVNRGFVFT